MKIISEGALFLLIVLVAVPHGVADDAALDRVRELNAAGKPVEAEALARELLGQVEATHGTAAAEVADVLDNLLGALYGQGRASEPEALEIVERALEIRRSALGERHPDVASSLTNLATVRQARGELAQALRSLEEALAIQRETLGPEHEDLALTLNNLATMLHQSGQPEAARARQAEALAIQRATLGDSHPLVAASIGNLGTMYLMAGKLDEARPLLEEALALDRERLGSKHPQIAGGLFRLARLAHVRGDAAAARPMYEEALEILRSTLGPGHPEVASVMGTLASLLLETDQLDVARDMYLSSVARLSEELGPQHALVGARLYSLAVMHHRVGDLEAARTHYEEALAIQRVALGPEHPDVARTLTQLAAMMQDAGELSAARPLLEKALAIRRAAFGDQHADVAESLTGLARLLHDLRDFAATRRLLEQSLAIRKALVGPTHPDVAMSLTNMGTLLLSAGDVASARPLLEEAVRIRRVAAADMERPLATSLNMLARAVMAEGDLAGARALFEEALAMRRASIGSAHFEVGMTLNDLGTLLEEDGKLAEARAHFEEALAIFRAALGDRHPHVAGTLSNLGGVHRRTGELSMARSALEEALSIQADVLDSRHPRMALLQSNLALVHAEEGDAKAALDLALKAEDVGRSHLALTAAGLSEREALRYARSRPSGLDVAISSALSAGSPSAVRRAWNEAIRSRAVVFDVMAERRQSAVSALELEPFNAAVRSAAERVARLTAGRSGAQHLERAREELESAERELGLRSAAYARMRQGAATGFSEVSAALDAGDALVAYRAFERVGGGDSYAAFVLSGPGAEPVLVSLGEAAVVESLISRWSRGMSLSALMESVEPGDVESHRAAAAELRRACWDPVAGLIGDARRVFVVLDGALLRIPLAALPTEDGGWLVESGPTFHYLSAERDLATASSLEEGSGRGLLVLGDPAYAAMPWTEVRVSWMSRAKVAVGALAALVAFRGGTLDCGRFEELSFRPLPGAEKEARAVARTWKRRAAHGRRSNHVTRLTGREATEEAFKTLAGDHRVLHLATHGFFLGSDCGGELEGSRGDAGGESGDEVSAASNPLLRSGLALAGFNLRADAPADADDGVLTAQEVASLDLSGVEWAVLSACDTGRGDISEGEGVLGLQRGFRMAGAHALVMSLWPVNDRSTREYMSALYRARLVDGLPAAECVRAASLHVLRELRRAGLPEHPYYWAAFVSSGSPD